MKHHSATLAVKTFRLTAAVLGFGIPIFAQGPRPPGDVDPAKARFEETSKREIQLRGLGNQPNKPVDPKQLQKLMTEVQQDFERILTLHNEIVRVITADRVLPVGFVADATGEIRKRASHLQTVLPLEKPDPNEHTRDNRKQFSDAQLKDALVMLCKHIERFVDNPIIKTPGTIDAQQSARARNDLADVIELGDTINKSARRIKERSP
jgi:hypothetical protein